jgi:hypothetical protein
MKTRLAGMIHPWGTNSTNSTPPARLGRVGWNERATGTDYTKPRLRLSHRGQKFPKITEKPLSGGGGAD